MDDFGIQKINLTSPIKKTKITSDKNQNSNLTEKSMKKNKLLRFKSKKLGVILGVILLVILLLGIYTFITVNTLRSDYQRLYAQAKKAAAAAKEQNVVLAKEELLKTDSELKTMQKDLNGLSFLNFIPLVNTYYQDAIHITRAGSAGLAAAVTVTDSVIPYADVLGLKGGKSFVGGSAEQRIQLTVKTMGKVVPNIDKIEKNLKLVREEIDKVNPDHYPNMWKFKKIREQLTQARDITDGAVASIEEAKPLIKVLPILLGEPDLKKYLVLFQNDKELRPTGGFLTYYAVFRVERGIIQIEKSSNIYDLDDSISGKPAAPDIITKYLPNESLLNIRNSNLSPDFIESMNTFRSLYAKSSDKLQVDGIIALDTHVLVHILDILGEVQAAGLTFNSKNDPACNCPQVVYQLESQISKPVNYIKQNRKALIGELVYAIMQKALSSSPKLYWGPLFQQGLKDIQEKHILFSLDNKDAQKGIESLNWAGRIRDYEGDYLHINDANFGGAKSNMYIQQAVKVEYDEKDGKILRTITIDYRNPEPYSDCNLERGGLCLNAKLRDFIRIYAPKGSTLTNYKGSEVKMTSKDDLGKTAFAGFLTVNPQGKSQLVVQSQFPYSLKKGSILPLLIQKQPGTDAVPYELYVNGKRVESFTLNTDREFHLTF